MDLTKDENNLPSDYERWCEIIKQTPGRGDVAKLANQSELAAARVTLSAKVIPKLKPVFDSDIREAAKTLCRYNSAGCVMDEKPFRENCTTENCTVMKKCRAIAEEMRK